MLKYTTKIFIAIILLSNASNSLANIKKILPKGLQLSFDIPRPLYYHLKEKTGIQYELNGNLDFSRILLDIDYGWGNILRKNPSKERTALAENIGQYFRIGLNYNFIKNSLDHNAAFLGIKYSKAYFKDYLYGKLNDKFQIWNDNSPSDIDQNDKMQARWFEIVAGVRVKVWKWIYTGCTARYKFAKKLNNNPSQTPFDIIGWGMNDNEGDAFGINFYLGLRVPLQVEPSAEQPTEKDVTLPKRKRKIQ